MSELEVATILKEIRELRDQVDILVNDKGLLTVEDAADYFSMGINKFRALCKNGLDGVIQVGGKVHRYIRIDVIKAKKDLEKRGFIKQNSGVVQR